MDTQSLGRKLSIFTLFVFANQRGLASLGYSVLLDLEHPNPKLDRWGQHLNDWLIQFAQDDLFDHDFMDSPISWIHMGACLPRGSQAFRDRCGTCLTCDVRHTALLGLRAPFLDQNAFFGEGI